jgi:hypothetical protein
MSKKQNHHIMPKEIQRKVLNVPFNDGVYDETTVPLDTEFHRKITHQTRFEGVPPAYTVGEIEKELFEEED